jgi:hypothetical protein
MVMAGSSVFRMDDCFICITGEAVSAEIKMGGVVLDMGIENLILYR